MGSIGTIFNKKKHRIVLASKSKARQEMLMQLGLEFETFDADVDENIKKGELPKHYTARVGRAKAEAAAKACSGCLVIAGDSTVSQGRTLLDKALTDDDVRKHLKHLSGRSCTVYTSVCVITPEGRVVEKVVTNKVKLKRLSQEEIEHYIASGEGIGKAGGFGIQGLGASFIRQMTGSYSSIVGLPLFELSQILKGI